MAIPPTPLTDAEVIKTLSDMEETIRYRLRMTEIFPVEMSQYNIGEFTGAPAISPCFTFIYQRTVVSISMFLNYSAPRFVSVVHPKMTAGFSFTWNF